MKRYALRAIARWIVDRLGALARRFAAVCATLYGEAYPADVEQWINELKQEL